MIILLDCFMVLKESANSFIITETRLTIMETINNNGMTITSSQLNELKNQSNSFLLFLCFTKGVAGLLYCERQSLQTIKINPGASIGQKGDLNHRILKWKTTIF